MAWPPVGDTRVPSSSPAHAHCGGAPRLHCAPLLTTQGALAQCHLQVARGVRQGARPPSGLGAPEGFLIRRIRGSKWPWAWPGTFISESHLVELLGWNPARGIFGGVRKTLCSKAVMSLHLHRACSVNRCGLVVQCTTSAAV